MCKSLLKKFSSLNYHFKEIRDQLVEWITITVFIVSLEKNYPNKDQKSFIFE